MTQLNNWDRSVYPAASEEPEPDLDIKAALESISGRTVQSFASIAARDSAFTALTTSAQKNGAMAHVVGQGLFVYTGSAWHPVPVGNPVRYWSGIVSTNASGDLSVPCSMNIGGALVSVPFPNALLSAMGGDAMALSAGVPLVFRWTSSSSSASTATFRAFFSDTGAPATNTAIGSFAFTAQMIGY